MIFTSSLLRGYQVLLGGPVISLTLFIVILMTDIPTKEMLESDVVKPLCRYPIL